MSEAPPAVQVAEVPEGAVVLDVREDDEWQAGHAPGALHVPMGDLPARLADLPDEELYVVCRSGGRSARAAAWLVRNGYDAVNVVGGMGAWVEAGRPLEAPGGAVPRVL
jgi:rhodanese-related sulfurtransferase